MGYAVGGQGGRNERAFHLKLVQIVVPRKPTPIDNVQIKNMCRNAIGCKRWKFSERQLPITRTIGIDDCADFREFLLVHTVRVCLRCGRRVLFKLFSNWRRRRRREWGGGGEEGTDKLWRKEGSCRDLCPSKRNPPSSHSRSTLCIRELQGQGKESRAKACSGPTEARLACPPPRPVAADVALAAAPPCLHPGTHLAGCGRGAVLRCFEGPRRQRESSAPPSRPTPSNPRRRQNPSAFHARGNPPAATLCVARRLMQP